MVRKSPQDVKFVVGTDNIPISVGNLPSPDTVRWGIRKKTLVVAAVRGGLISLDEVLRLYSLAIEEYLSWESQLDSKGYVGLGTTNVRILKKQTKEVSKKSMSSSRSD